MPYMSFEEYDKKPYAKTVESFPYDAEISVKIPSGRDVPPESLEGWLDPGSDYVAGNIVQFINAFMPKIEGLADQSLTAIQQQEVKNAIKSAIAYAYAEGRKKGLEDGMFAWDSFLDFPLDQLGSEYEEAYRPIQESAIQRYAHYFSDPSTVGDQWTQLHLVFEPDAVVAFAQGHWMSWQKALYWLERVGSIAHAHCHISKKNTIYNKAGMFAELLYLFDVFEMDYMNGMQCYLDTCDFYETNPTDSRREGVNWKIMREAFTVKDAEAVLCGVPVKDIFTGR